MAVSFQGFNSTPQLVSGPITTDFGLIYAGTLGTLALTVPGARPGMHFLISAPDLAADLAIVSAECAAKDVIDLRILNATVGNVDPASITLYIMGL